MDECSSYIEKKNETKRSSGYKIDLTVDTVLIGDSFDEVGTDLSVKMEMNLQIPNNNQLDPLSGLFGYF